MNPEMLSNGQKTVGGTTYNIFRHRRKGTTTWVRISDKILTTNTRNHSKLRRIAKEKH